MMRADKSKENQKSMIFPLRLALFSSLFGCEGVCVCVCVELITISCSLCIS